MICCAFSTANFASSRRPIPKALTKLAPRSRPVTNPTTSPTSVYGVPSGGDGLPRREKGTGGGGGEWRRGDGAAVWNARPENRQLPSLLQCLQIRWHTRKKDWPPPQRKMMGKAGKYHAVRV